MGASAFLALMLGLGVEAHRQALRYRYCQEMVRRHSAWKSLMQGDAERESGRIRKLDVVVSRLAGLRPQSLDELVAGSGDPALTAWFLKGQRRELLTGGEERSFSPRELIDHIEHFWGRGWRDTERAIRHNFAEHARLETVP